MSFANAVTAAAAVVPFAVVVAAVVGFYVDLIRKRRMRNFRLVLSVFIA